jgi:N6-L-threonylcarbamoyladenine synthase/protein kinase Bud32
MRSTFKGAEAEVYLLKDKAIKIRSSKDYRIKEIDSSLRISRTKREAKVIEKLRAAGIDAPKVLNEDYENSTLELERIKGVKLRDGLFLRNCKSISSKIGKIVAKVHNCGIIHGDLTTSNMILNKDTNKITLIDFGLSYFSQKAEDKAVDIHLLRQALESKHYSIWKKAFNSFLRAYESEANCSKEVINRLEIVECRGRNKNKKAE